MPVPSPGRHLYGLLLALALAGCTSGLKATPPTATTDERYHSGKIQQLFVVVPDANAGLAPRAGALEAEPTATADRIATTAAAPAPVSGTSVPTAPVAPPAAPIQERPMMAAVAQRGAAPAALAPAQKSPQFLAAEAWQDLYRRIRRQQVEPALAATEFARRHQALVKAFAAADFGSTRHSYPLLGYATQDGKLGTAYTRKGYRFFASSAQSAHPAYDLPIRDANRDGRDDRSGRPVPVVAYSGGVVVAVAAGWSARQPGPDGNYVWLFDPRDSRYYCYAQLDLVAVAVGDVVRTGEQLGTAGRSGDRASRATSTTHLHLLTLRYRNGKLTPYEIWPGLVAARRST